MLNKNQSDTWAACGIGPLLVLLSLGLAVAGAASAEPAVPVAKRSVKDKAKAKQKAKEQPVAKEKPAPALSAMDAITVTATRTERSAFDVPESVSVIDFRQMEMDQAANPGDVLENLANVDISAGPRPISEEVTIRGLSSQRILFLMDGARQNFSSGHRGRMFVEPDLLKQVEVLRGPASGVWGSGALGGVISYTTKDAADLLPAGERFGFRVRSGFQGVNSEWLGSGAAFGQLGDKFDYLANFAYRDAADVELSDAAWDFPSFSTRLNHSAFQLKSGLLKVNFWPAQDHNLNFSMQAFNQDGAVPSNPANTLSRGYGILLNRVTQQYNYTLRYRYENDGNRLLRPEALLYYNTTDSGENLASPPEMRPRQDQTGLATLGFGLRNSMAFGKPAALGQLLTYGVDYFADTTRSTRNGAPRNESPDGRLAVFGTYVQNELTLMERWSAIVGLRYDDYTARADSGLFPERAEGALSLRGGLGWDVTDWLSLHGAYGEAFRAPNVNEMFVTGVHFICGLNCENIFIPNPGLRPEKANNQEAGLRLKRDDLFQSGDRGRFRFAYFVNDVEDFIDSIVDFSQRPPGGVTTVRNVRNAALEGFEVDMTYDAPWYFSGLAYGQTRGQDAATGAHLNAIPADKWVLNVGLRVPAWEWTLGWRTTFVDAQNRVPDRRFSTPGYTVHDLYLSWLPSHGTWRGLRLDFGVDNLTNEPHRRHLAVLPEPAMNIKTTVSYSF